MGKGYTRSEGYLLQTGEGVPEPLYRSNGCAGDRHLRPTRQSVQTSEEALRASTTLTLYLDACREIILDELKDLVPANRYGPILYDLMLENALRRGKALRPSLCIAVTGALGG